MATLDLSAFNGMLKEHYSDDFTRQLAYTDNVLFGLLPKKMAGGDYYVQPIDHGKPGGSSADFATAQSNQYSSLFKSFLITRKFQYITPKVSTEVVLASREKADAFAPAFDEFDKGHRSLSEKINRRLYRGASGRIGRLKSGAAINGATITLDDPADVWNFEPGDKIAFSTADGTGSLLDSGATVTVVSISPQTSVVTTNSADIGTEIASLTDTSYVFQAGDHAACISGLEDWLPVDNRATKLAASFFGVTRSVDPERLGGVYLDASTSYGDLNEVVTTLIGESAARGGKPDLLMMNHRRFIELQNLWLSKQVVMQNISVDVSETVNGRKLVFSTAFPGMRAMVGGFVVDVMIDRTCPSNRLYALTRKTWKIWHSGPLPCFPNAEMGASILTPAATADAYEGRVGAYHNLGCSAPSHNAVASLPTLAI